MKLVKDFISKVNDLDEATALSVFTIVPGILFLIGMYVFGFFQSALTGGQVFTHGLPASVSSPANASVHAPHIEYRTRTAAQTQPVAPAANFGTSLSHFHTPVLHSTFFHHSQTGAVQQYQQEPSYSQHFGYPRQLSSTQSSQPY